MSFAFPNKFTNLNIFGGSASTQIFILLHIYVYTSLPGDCSVILSSSLCKSSSYKTPFSSKNLKFTVSTMSTAATNLY